MLSAIQDFESSIASGLTGDYSLSTLWGNLVDAQSQAASDLATAQQNYADAQRAVTDAGADATSDQLAALATAQDALTAAQQAASAATSNLSVNGLQSSLGQVLASAQQFASDLQSLISDGASQAEINQIVGMGQTAGDQLAQALLAAGPSSVTQLARRWIRSLTSRRAQRSNSPSRSTVPAKLRQRTSSKHWKRSSPSSRQRSIRSFKSFRESSRFRQSDSDRKHGRA